MKENEKNSKNKSLCDVSCEDDNSLGLNTRKEEKPGGTVQEKQLSKLYWENTQVYKAGFF